MSYQVGGERSGPGAPGSSTQLRAEPQGKGVPGGSSEGRSAAEDVSGAWVRVLREGRALPLKAPVRRASRGFGSFVL